MMVMSRSGGSGAAAGGSIVSNKEVEVLSENAASTAATVVLTTPAAMWVGAKRVSRVTGGTYGDNFSSASTILDASEVMESATRWLADNPVLQYRKDTSIHRHYPRAPPPTPASTPKWICKTARSSHSVNLPTSEVTVDPPRMCAAVESGIITDERAFARVLGVAEPPHRHSLKHLPKSTPRQQRHCPGQPSVVRTEPLDGKRKRNKDSVDVQPTEGVEGLGQQLKRVCLKAKFHRRTRRHVSSEDLARIGSLNFIDAPACVSPETAPDNADGSCMERTSDNKSTYIRSLGTDIAPTLSDFEHASFAPRDASISHGTSRSSKVKMNDDLNEIRVQRSLEPSRSVPLSNDPSKPNESDQDHVSMQSSTFEGYSY